MAGKLRNCNFVRMEPKRIEQIACSAVQDFLFHHESDDETRWILAHQNVAGVPADALAEQVQGRRKAKGKLPSFYRTRGVVYPPRLNLEQASSETTARYKVHVLRALLGPHATAGADLTGGWGVDSFFQAALVRDLYYAEPDPDLVQLAQHNLHLLGRNNIHYINAGVPASLAFLPPRLDFAFLDPSRRAGGKKVIALTDYEPDVRQVLNHLFEKTLHVLIKTSPLLDITEAARMLPELKSAHVVAVQNECKELLLLCERGHRGPFQIIAADLSNSTEFAFTTAEEARASVSIGEPKTYLYEPGAALLKAGAFRLMAERFQLTKLHLHTHLYTSDQLVADFPGRIFEVTALRPDAIPGKKANVVTRNFPEDAASLKKKLRLADGGESYVLAFTGPHSRHVVVCKRLQ